VGRDAVVFSVISVVLVALTSLAFWSMSRTHRAKLLEVGRRMMRLEAYTAARACENLPSAEPFVCGDTGWSPKRLSREGTGVIKTWDESPWKDIGFFIQKLRYSTQFRYWSDGKRVKLGLRADFDGDGRFAYWETLGIIGEDGLPRFGLMSRKGDEDDLE